jgi:hypothetical protein
MTLQYVIEVLIYLIVEFIRSIERQNFIADILAAWLIYIYKLLELVVLSEDRGFSLFCLSLSKDRALQKVFHTFSVKPHCLVNFSTALKTSRDSLPFILCTFFFFSCFFLLFFEITISLKRKKVQFLNQMAENKLFKNYIFKKLLFENAENCFIKSQANSGDF